MDTAAIITKAIANTYRADIDRAQALFYLNTARKEIIRDNDIPRFYQYIENVALAGGKFSPSALDIKSIKAVESSKAGRIELLDKISDYRTARIIYPDFTVAGDPLHYLERGTEVIILPQPAAGTTINVLAEVWPSDLADSETAGDILTVEIPEILIYFVTAEIFKDKGEPDKFAQWRQDAQGLLNTYIERSLADEAHGAPMFVKGYY
jgi:hypothetical protein